MVDFGSTTIITCCAVLGGALTAFAETLHAKRVRLSAPLAFGPSFHPANWTQALPALRAILIAGAIWGLMTLISLDGSRAQSKAEGERHLFVLLDVSPSMLIEDAGPERNQRRALRAAEVLESVLNRAPGNHLKISLSAFYTTQKPLIQESIDRNLILYMAKDLPLHIAFKAGKTNLLEALNKTAAQCSKL
jgi:Ca-activated chloride channel family protein